MSMMYCYKCDKNVHTKKNDFNIGLAIFLAIFTGGIGLLIYVAIYLDKEHKPRCIHCNSVCYEQIENNLITSNYQLVSSSNQMQNQQFIVEKRPVDEKTKFCYNCGVELNQREHAKFCPLCGSPVE
ncbi:MAG: hypothetical protein ACFFB8_06080 [Promethearchaeota archaeon]